MTLDGSPMVVHLTGEEAVAPAPAPGRAAAAATIFDRLQQPNASAGTQQYGAQNVRAGLFGTARAMPPVSRPENFAVPERTSERSVTGMASAAWLFEETTSDPALSPGCDGVRTVKVTLRVAPAGM